VSLNVISDPPKRVRQGHEAAALRIGLRPVELL